ncbi:MAG: hypothetical protein FJ029_11305 [Actinobacteria bacterium]|nr:hypothetical protein [Actinomycetota bacterium]
MGTTGIQGASGKRSIEAGEDECSRRLMACLSSAVEALFGQQNVLMEGFELVGKYTIQRSRDQIHAVICLQLKAYNSTVAALPLIMKGHYIQAVVLIRSVFEDWLMTTEVMLHPDESPGLWRTGKEGPPSGKVRPFQAIAKSLGLEAGKSWDATYGLLSEIAHPRSLSIRMQVAKRTKSYRYGPKYDDYLASHSLFYLGKPFTGSFLFNRRCSGPLAGIYPAGNPSKWRLKNNGTARLFA